MVVKKLAVLFSGGGSNLEAILQKLHGKTFGGTKIEVVLTLSNKADAGGIAKAAKFGLKSVILNHKDFASRARTRDRKKRRGAYGACGLYANSHTRFYKQGSRDKLAPVATASF